MYNITTLTFLQKILRARGQARQLLTTKDMQLAFCQICAPYMETGIIIIATCPSFMIYAYDDATYNCGGGYIRFF